ncbi:MAG TPA: penicillin-binding protein activator [Flavitalea sp.]|nr:penicillin-binding protein activator [Flavitalea sp.]
MQRFPFLFSLLVLLLLSSACTHDNPTEFYKMVKVDGLFSLTGNWSSLGAASQAAIQIGVVDANLYLQRKAIPYRLIASVHDTKLDPQTAATLFTQSTTSGVRFVIGPQSSAELAAIKPISDASNILLVSQGSTAGSLAIDGDAIYRFCPADKIEGAKIAESIFEGGIRALVTVARDDAGNTGLQAATGNAFIAAGGVVEATVPYPAAQTNFSSLVLEIKDKLNTLKQTYSEDQIGIYLASFDECVALFSQAATDTELKSIHWFGGDGIVKNVALQSNAVAAAFADSTKFFAPEFGIPGSSEALSLPIAKRIKAKTGQEPDAFALAVYDAIFVIAKAIESSNGVPDDRATLLTAFTTAATAYSGITGPTMLDTAGDRANGSYNFWGLRSVNGVYGWVVVGKSK